MAHIYLVATGSHSLEELAEQTEVDGIFQDMVELAAEVYRLRLPMGE
jgi:hypothetical protein